MTSHDPDVLHLVPGTTLPDISLASTRGDVVSLVAITTPTVLYFYPWTGRPDLPNPPNWDDIPGAHGSTPEAEGFRDHHDEFSNRGIAIYGISAQDTAYQNEFATRLGLPFDLLSDVDYALQKALKLPTFETGGTTYLRRLTLVVSRGRIDRCFYPVEDPGSHAAQILADLER